MLKEFNRYLSTLSGVSEIKIEDNGIFFKYNNLSFLFVIDESDPYYIRLILPNIIIIDESNRDRLNKLIDKYNVDFKAIKAIKFKNNIWLVIEQFVYSRERISDLFERMINLLVNVINIFRNENLN